MSDIQFNCPKCGHSLIVDSQGIGMTVACPECSEPIDIPRLKPPLSDAKGQSSTSEPLSVHDHSALSVESQSEGMPRGARIAVMLLYICIGIGVIRGILESMGIFETLIVLGAMSLLTYLIGKGHNWARILYGILFAIGTPLSITPLIQSIKANLLSGLLGTGQVCIQICALIILFRNPVAYWYRRTKQSKDKDIDASDNNIDIRSEDQIKSLKNELRGMQRNMRNVILGFTVSLLVMALWLEKNNINSASGTEIKAHRYYVIDSRGTERAMLGINNDGSSGLSLLDNRGRLLAAIGSDPDGISTLAMYDSRGEMRAMMGVGQEGSMLAFHDENGISRASLEVQPDGVPLLHMKDSGGRPRAQLMADDIGTPSLTLFGKNRKMLLNLWAHDDAPYGLQLWSAQNDLGVMLALESDGRPVLSLAGGDLNSRIWAGMDEDGRPSMAMVGNGRPVWSAP